MRGASGAALAALLIAAAGPGAGAADPEPASRPAPARGGLPALGIAEGEPFPDIVLPSAEDGRPMSLADYRGKKVVLHVFASW